MSFGVASELAKESLHALVKPKEKKPEAEEPSKPAELKNLFVPSIEDIAVLSSTISADKVPVFAPNNLDVDGIKDKYRETFRSTRSHNLLYERLMGHFKAAGLQGLMGLLGVDPKEIANIQTEVREEALKEIDQRLGVDWAQAKATMEIVG